MWLLACAVLLLSRCLELLWFPQAIEFVQMQRDDELWELLISLALSDADMTGALLPPSLQCSYVVPSTCILRSSVVRNLHSMK